MVFRTLVPSAQITRHMKQLIMRPSPFLQLSTHTVALCCYHFHYSRGSKHSDYSKKRELGQY